MFIGDSSNGRMRSSDGLHAGSNPASPTINVAPAFSGVQWGLAQLVAQQNLTLKVGGSSPPSLTNVELAFSGSLWGMNAKRTSNAIVTRGTSGFEDRRTHQLQLYGMQAHTDFGLVTETD